MMKEIPVGVLVQLVLCLLLTELPSTKAADGILGDADQKSLGYYADFAASRSDLPLSFCAIIRLQTTATEIRSPDVIVRDDIALFCENRKENESFWCLGTKIAKLEDFAFARTYWQQLLSAQGKRSRRSGTTGRFGPGVTEKSEDSSVTEDESELRLNWKPFDPYFVPFAMEFDRVTGRVTSTFPEMLLQHIELKKSARKKDGTIVSLWSFYERSLEYTFDAKVDFLPTQVVGRALVKDGEPGEIEFIHRIRWTKLRKSDGKSILVPSEFNHLRFEADRAPNELRGRIRWLDCEKKDLIPDRLDQDWREPIRLAFDEDWSMDFDSSFGRGD